MSSGITVESLLSALPQALRQDESICALAAAAAQVLVERHEEIDSLRIYARIDELDEELLDILAYDFKVDWWDHRYTLEQKRKTLRDSFAVHRHLGTKYSVETALSAVYPRAVIQEWFEYGGEPYTFRLLVDVSGQVVNLDLHRRAIELIDYYKNLRSHLRRIEYTAQTAQPAFLYMGGGFSSCMRLQLPELPDALEWYRTVHTGGLFGGVVELPVPECADILSFERTLGLGGGISSVGELYVPEQADRFDFEQELQIGSTYSGSVQRSIPERADRLRFDHAAVLVASGSMTANLPIPVRRDGLVFERVLQTGGDAAAVTTLYLPEK